MKQLILVIALFSLSACGNAKWSENAGTPPGNTDITVTPATPAESKNETLIFANHGDNGKNAYTSVQTVGRQEITFPSSGLLISYSSKANKADLILTINNQYVCTYQWDGAKFSPHQSCSLTVIVDSGSVVKVSGMPSGQTVVVPVTTILK